MRPIADKISRACIPYDPCWRNSNSTARDILEEAGLPIPVPGPEVPGWGVPLDKPRPTIWDTIGDLIPDLP